MNTQAEQVQALVATAMTVYGRLDYACNNAGIEGQAAPTAACTEANWNRVLDVNLKGVWLSMKYELQAMLRNKRPTGQGATIRGIESNGMLLAAKTKK